MNIFKLSAITLSALAFSTSAYAQNYSYNSGYNAHESCKASETKQKLIGGGIGAIAGAVIGSQISGNGARTEGSAIGAVIGGLAGGGIADKRIDCDPIYSHTTQPVYSQNTYSQPTYSQHRYSQQPQKKIVYVQQAYPTPSHTVHQGQSARYQTIAAQPTSHYPVRTTHSDHPVYSNPSYGIASHQTYTSPQRTERFTTRPAPQMRKDAYTTRYVNHSNLQPSRHSVVPVHHHGRFQCVEQH
jgi:uncharacterized protein YcfJ